MAIESCVLFCSEKNEKVIKGESYKTCETKEGNALLNGFYSICSLYKVIIVYKGLKNVLPFNILNEAFNVFLVSLTHNKDVF